ncbi:sugar transporter ERD6-like 8 [Lathyrus oleraceus]|uniref:sugar transporter ERD6-like 8 n=1 Tax=Pisum sativum TaxID=3888 RepID=UPI0021D235FD|nr:sugar transporter ERD6-like 8 [Pisum sativum]
MEELTKQLSKLPQQFKQMHETLIKPQQIAFYELFTGDHPTSIFPPANEEVNYMGNQEQGQASCQGNQDYQRGNNVLATILTLWLADKSGRRLLLIVSSSAMALSLLVVSISFYLKEYISPDSDLYATLSLVSVAGVVVMVIAFSLGLGAMPWIIMSEILPINIKGLAGSFATLANWFFSWIGTRKVSFKSDVWNKYFDLTLAADENPPLEVTDSHTIEGYEFKSALNAMLKRPYPYHIVNSDAFPRTVTAGKLKTGERIL